MPQYKEFHRKYAVLTIAQLASPKLHPINKLTLLPNSILHYLPKDTVDNGLESRDPTVVNYEKAILIQHADSLASEEGKPRGQASQLKKMERDYHKRYRRFRPLRRLESGLRDPHILIVINYAMLQHVYRYNRNALSDFNSWLNLQNTWVDHIKSLSKVSDRQHYLEVRLPEHLPTLPDLTLAENKFTTTTANLFKTPEHLFLLDLWLWLTPETESLSTLSSLNESEIRNINLIFTESSKWSVLSMRNLLEWKENAGIQKLFMGYLNTLFAARTVIETLPEDLTEDVVELESDITVTKTIRTKAIVTKAEELANTGLLSGAEYKRILKMAEKYTEIPNPSGEGTLEDLLNIDPSVVETVPVGKIRDINAVVDKSMLESSLNEFESKYVSEVMERDIANVAMSVQRLGIAVTDYKVEQVVDAINNYNSYTVKITPVTGASSTLRFRIPVIEKDGTFIANGVRCRLTKQRGDLPIRKTSDNQVALTSYYGKSFVNRSERSVHDYGKWLVKQITNKALDPKDNSITDIDYGSVYDGKSTVPRIYSGIASGISGFKSSGFTFSFDFSKRIELYGEKIIKSLEVNGHVVCGQGKGKFVTVDKLGNWYSHADSNATLLGDSSTLFNIQGKVPIEVTEIKIFNKSIPVGILLAHELGLDKLLRKLKVKHRTVSKGTRVTLTDDEYTIQFLDETLIISKADTLASLIIGGFNNYRKSIAQYDMADFNHKDVYFNVLNDHGLGIRFIREMDLLVEFFVDHITRELLIGMKEPTEVVDLLIRASELLATDEYPDETDTAWQRFKGYERISGMVYRQMVDSARQYKSRPVTSKATFDLNPRAVWIDLMKDQSITQVEDSNPIHNLKEKELVTFTGQGGRSAQSMVKRSRVFHPNDVGVISEATPDSAKVAINTYMTSNPNLNTLRGLTKRFDKKVDGAGTALSTTAMLSPGADRDSAKRTNFASIQHSSTVAGKGYVTSPLRTGYEQVVAHRVDPLYAFAAKSDGIIAEVSDHHVLIEYKDDTSDTVELGKVFGKVAGVSVPHTIICDLDVNKKVKAGDIISYNTGFFERDFFDRTQVTWKAGALVNVALMESSDSLEDSAAVSEAAGLELATPVTKLRSILVTANTTIHNLVSVGDTVTTDTILCTLEDEITATSDLFDSATLDTLAALTANTPKAKMSGTVEKVEVIYHGDKSDMSDSLKRIVTASDRLRSNRVTSLRNGKSKTGAISETVHVDGSPLTLDQAVIRIYITGESAAGVGDKAVFGHQLKTIFGRVMVGRNETQSGITIDGIFSYASISARIVQSPELMGTTNTLLKLISKEAAAIYRK